MTDNAKEEWETEEAEIQRPVGAVISVRVSQDLAERLFAEAERREVKTSTIVREAIEVYLEAGALATSQVDLSISTAEGGSVTIYQGRSHYGRTAAAPAETNWEPVGSR